MDADTFEYVCLRCHQTWADTTQRSCPSCGSTTQVYPAEVVNAVTVCEDCGADDASYGGLCAACYALEVAE